MAFKFKIEPTAFIDIQHEIDFYNDKKKGLGRKFWLELNNYFKSIRKNPFYQVRYDDVRCLPLKKFPAMIHFTVNEIQEIIIIRAIINTHKDPKSNWL